MALTLVEKKKQQKILILVLVAVLLITATVLWFGFLKKEPVVNVSAEPQDVVQPIPQQVEVNFDVLSLPLLQELDSPAEPVLEPSSKGRNNPFLPF
jgi:flagellar basal body-associated protein FliL